MRKTCLDQVYALAQKDERIFFIGSDLGYETLKEFKKEMPDRFLMEGVSEQNLIGISAGLAMEGKIVYANTIATFLSRRCFEQIVLDMTIVAPCDAEEMKRLMPLTVNHQGPMYIRIAKGGDPIVSTDRVPFKI